MSTNETTQETEASDVNDIQIPVKRTTGDTLEERLTANAYHNILPARYLKKIKTAISKCVERGTLVQTDSGVRRIENFADVQEPDLEPDTYYDAREDISIGGVSVESMYYAGRKDATTVRFDSGAMLTGASNSHSVKTPSGWTILSNLKEGMLFSLSLIQVIVMVEKRFRIKWSITLLQMSIYFRLR